MDRLILPITFKAPAKSKDGTMHIGEFYPTINHVYQYIQKNKGAFKKIRPEAQTYLQEVSWLAKQWVRQTGWEIPDKNKKVIIRYWFWFKNGHRPDCGNLEKVITDSLEGIIFHNDRMILPRMIDFDFSPSNPRIELSFEVVE